MIWDNMEAPLFYPVLFILLQMVYPPPLPHLYNHSHVGQQLVNGLVVCPG